ncbi:MAG: nucleotidyltransferase family protein [Eubacterium sp.]|nr:nucleotidyltransferase family protein [Eubacterium sp.]
MDTREYFIYLLFCHLNGIDPRGERRYDWERIYDLAKKNNVVAIIAYEIERLPEDFRPKGELLELFYQSLDSQKESFDSRLCSLAIFMSTMSGSKISHLIIKGTALRINYPVPALRSGSDIDVIVHPLDYTRTIEALKLRGFTEASVKRNEARMRMDDDVFEIRTELENINIQSKIYFSMPFDDISEAMGYTYKLKAVYHLLYIVTHIAHHLKEGGSGVRMIMDMDVLIRSHPHIDINEFLLLCENIKIEKTAQALLALTRKWFNTPVSLNFTFEDGDMRQLLKSLTSAVLSGGVFCSAEAERAEKPVRKSKCRILELIIRFFEKLFGSEDQAVNLSEREMELMRELGISRAAARNID